MSQLSTSLDEEEEWPQRGLLGWAEEEEEGGEGPARGWLGAAEEEGHRLK
jgi:hypothetical protein